MVRVCQATPHCRIKNYIDEVGIADLRSRKKAAHEPTKIMSQAFGMRDTCGIMCLTRERVVAHKLYAQCMSGNKEVAAEAK